MLFRLVAFLLEGTVVLSYICWRDRASVENSMDKRCLNMGFAKGFKRFCGAIDKACLMLVVVMIALMVGITCAQIICRVWFKALSWSDEATRYLLIWATFLGASCVYRARGHISITLLQNALPHHKLKKALELLVHGLCIIVFVICIYYGIQYAGKQSAQLSPALRIPMTYIYAAIPAGFGLMLLQAVDQIVQTLFSKEGEVS